MKTKRMIVIEPGHTGTVIGRTRRKKSDTSDMSDDAGSANKTAVIRLTRRSESIAVVDTTRMRRKRKGKSVVVAAVSASESEK